MKLPEWTILVFGLMTGCDTTPQSSPDEPPPVDSQNPSDQVGNMDETDRQANVEPLRHERSGPYAELIARDNPDGLIVVFMPSLYSWLSQAERVKGAALSSTEVTRIRDASPAIAVTAEQAKRLNADRGYADVDPQNAYGDWERMKAE
jgi:hypothetical protein